MAEEEYRYASLLQVECNRGHQLYWFACKHGKNKGKIYWKSNYCTTFYSHNYIEMIAPYDEIEKIVKCHDSI